MEENLTAAQFLTIWNNTFEGEDLDDTWNIVQEGDWEISYKDYASRDKIYTNGKQFFMIVENRSGSYYSEYHYDEPECHEVVPKEVITTVYIAKQ